MAPGFATPSSRAAMLTPSPIRSPSASSTTSPRWRPTRIARAQRFLRLLALRDVPEVHDECAHARLAEQIGHGVLSPEPFAKFMTNEPLGPVDAAGAPASCCKFLLGVSKLIGMDEVEGRCHGVGGLVAEEHDENQLFRISIPSGDHSPGDLALSPVHA